LESNNPMAKNNSNEPRTLEIRKYQNRRYYDRTRSRHLSLQQIHKLIIEGYKGVQNEMAALREEVSKLKAQFKLRSSPPRK